MLNSSATEQADYLFDGPDGDGYGYGCGGSSGRPNKTRLYQSSTIEHLDDFITNISSLFQRPELSDLTLVIEQQDVKVNRSLLAARSEYFHALLFNGMRETSLTRIELPTAELSSFKSILRFIYSGKLPLGDLTSEELAKLLVTARYFCLDKLVCDIALYLRLHINKSNVWLLYRVAKLHYIDQLAEACVRFFDKNAETILQHEEFNNLSVVELKEMVSRDSFYASEKAILRAICVYYRNNIEEKTQLQCLQLLKDLLESVRLSLMSENEVISIFAEFNMPIYDPTVEVYYSLDKHRSSLPILDPQLAGTKRSISNLKSPKKRAKLSLPVTTTPAFPYQGNDMSIESCDVIEELSNRVIDTCATAPTSKFKYQPPLGLFLDITSVIRQEKESIRGFLVYNKNIATKEFNVEPIKGRLKKDLVCGSDRNYNIRTCTNHTLPYYGSSREEYIQIAFGRPFIVNNIRMLLLDDGQRSFSYIIEVSVDGRNWTKVVDYSRYWCRSWQHLFFKERVVKHVKITGTRSQFYGTGSGQMSVVYFDCMYNTMDSQMYSLSDEGGRPIKSKKGSSKEQFVEPKSSIIEIGNAISLTSSSNGTMRHFRLRAKGNSVSGAANNPTITTSQNIQLYTGLASSMDISMNQAGSPSQQNGPNLIPQTNMHYRTTDFARGSANWNSPGRITFQLAQPFKINSFAFKIVPPKSATRSHYSYVVSISNDLDRGSWKTVQEVNGACGRDLTVVRFEAQLVTFIEIRSADYPNTSPLFSVKQFECPYLTEQE